jgi:hypothetical protein
MTPMRKRVYRLILWALIAVPLAIACGEDATVPDPEDVRDGSTQIDASTDTATPDTSVADAADAGIDAADVVCPVVVPDDAIGVYVTTTGTDTAGCGALNAPCKTIGTGITRARLVGRTKVYVARGTYVEHLTLAKDTEVVGGWEAIGTTWTRACVAPEEAVIVRAPSTHNVTASAINLGGETRLSLLRIESKPEAQVALGESLYGIYAFGFGATTELVMTNVVVDVANARAGANGTNGDKGADGGASCPAGAGGNGAAGSQGSGAPAGVFDGEGYEAGVASAGGAASVGGNGTAAGAGTCVQCGSCATAIPPACALVVDAPQSCGSDGTSGCGGGPGGKGGPALGGGSNVGVYSWAAAVTINGGKIRSGNAGNGGTGGAGGVGGGPTRGRAGDAGATCVTSCTFDVGLNLCADGTKGAGKAGDAGGAGGFGGTGGSGGGGGGGSSFAIYSGGAGVITTSATTVLAHGTAGAGGPPVAGVGANGAAADRVP